MRLDFSPWLLAAAASLAFAGGRLAPADDPPRETPLAPLAKADSGGTAAPVVREIVFGDNVAKMTVDLDRKEPALTFRLSTPKVTVSSAPIVLVLTKAGPKKFTLAAVPGQAGAWRLFDPIVLEQGLEGVMELVVNGTSYTTPLVSGIWLPPPEEGKWAARHGGRVVSFADCPAHVEVVTDVANGTLTLYPLSDTTLTEAPEVQLSARTEAGGTLTVTPVEGPDGVWKASHPALKDGSLGGSRLKIRLKGRPCEAPLLATPHGGTLVLVAGGPRFEMVRNESARTYTFFVLDPLPEGQAPEGKTPEGNDGKTTQIQNAEVAVTTDEGPKTYALTRVEGEPKAWRLSGFDPAADRDATLRISIGAKTLTAPIRLAPFGNAK